MTVSTDGLSKTESSFVKPISSKSMEVFPQIIQFVFVAFRNYISGTKFLVPLSFNTDPHGHWPHDSCGGGGRPEGSFSIATVYDYWKDYCSKVIAPIRI